MLLLAVRILGPVIVLSCYSRDILIKSRAEFILLKHSFAGKLLYFLRSNLFKANFFIETNQLVSCGTNQALDAYAIVPLFGLL